MKGCCEKMCSCHAEDREDGARSEILYSVDDVPPWYLTIILGFQHYLLMLGSISMPIAIAKYICVEDDYVGLGEIISTAFFVSGIGTVIQSTIGTRLPIVQSNSPTFLAPIIAFMNLPDWKCPATVPGHLLNDTSAYIDWRRGEWTLRMRQVQGSLALAGIAQVLLGVTGIIGLLLPFIGPLVIAPSVALIGLSLFPIAADVASTHWGIAFLTVVLATVFSQYFRFVNLPFCRYRKGNGWSVFYYPLFKLLPIVLSIAIAWIFCAILTAADVFPDKEDQYGYAARTDKLDRLHRAKWFRFPYPGQWGLPTYSAAGVLAMIAAIIAGIIESIGDYYACARLAEAPPPPVHAVNRGVTIEGIGIIAAGIWGTGTGLTSYSENVGAIGITKVGSRRVVQVAGLCMIFFGMLGKFGALFVTIPEPIIGGLFLVVFGMVTAVGVSNLQYVDLNSTRNLYIFGFSMLLGLTLPHWMSTHQGVIQTGNSGADQVITVLLSTQMFVGGFVGFILDNTIPGSAKERGILAWRENGDGSDHTSEEKLAKAYDLPFIMKWIRRWRWTRFVPICPTFDLSWIRLPCRRKVRREPTDAKTPQVHRLDVNGTGTENGGFDGITVDKVHTSTKM